MSNSQSKAASIAKVAVWERNVPRFMESGQMNDAYLAELIQAGRTSQDPQIRQKCLDKYNEHVSLSVEFD
jgi:hypothetical protein